jgi:hypothetical protein
MPQVWKSPAVVRLLLASLLTTSGCIQPQSAAPAVSVDGDYRGSATRFQVLNRACPRPGLLTLHVQAGVTYYRWVDQYIVVTAQSNGTLSGALPGVQLTGTYDGTTLQGDVTDGQCGLHFTLKKVGT